MHRLRRTPPKGQARQGMPSMSFDAQSALRILAANLASWPSNGAFDA
jgi:hypothetical protein